MGLAFLCILLFNSCSRKEKWFLKKDQTNFEVNDSEWQATIENRLENNEVFNRWRDNELEWLYYWELNGNVVIDADGQIYTDRVVMGLWNKENTTSYAQTRKGRFETYLQKLKKSQSERKLNVKNILTRLKSKINFNLLFLILIVVVGVWWWRRKG